MMTAPLSKIDVAVSLIRNLSDRNTHPSGEELAMLERLVSQAAKMNELIGKSFRGAYFALAGDFEQARICHMAAIEACPQMPSVYFNYSVTLSRFKRYKEATEMALKAAVLSRGAPNHVHALLVNAYWSDDQEILENWLPFYEKTTGQPHPVTGWLKEDAEDEAEMMAMVEQVHSGRANPIEALRHKLGFA